jgi:hypothetical protein
MTERCILPIDIHPFALLEIMKSSANHFAMSRVLSHVALLGKRYAQSTTLMILLFALAAFLAYITRVNGVTHDLFHAMALARDTIAQGSFPQNDTFAFTPTISPTVHHEWGFGVIAYLTTAHSDGGIFLMSLKFLLVALLFLCCYRVCRQRGGQPIFFALSILIALPFFWVGFATIRAQLFTLVAISIQMVMLEADWRGRRAWILGWLILLLAWLNIHAGFVIGAAMMAFHGIERCIESWSRTRNIREVVGDTWHLFAAAPIAVLLLFVNPYGSEYIVYLAYGLTMPRPLIAEWGPLWTTYEPMQTMFFFAISVALLLYAGRHRRWTRLRGFLFLLFCAVMAVKHIRHGSIYGLIWLAYVPAWISHTPLGDRLQVFLSRKRILLAQASVVMAAFCLGYALWYPFWKAYLPVTVAGERGNYPLGAIAYLERSDFHGRLITDFDTGAYVTWRLYPNVLVSLDGRYEAAFQPGVMEDHLALFGCEGEWGKWLDRWEADGLIIPSGSKLGKELQAEASHEVARPFPGSTRKWKCFYSDPGTMVWLSDRYHLPAETDQPLPADGRYPQ